MLTVILPLNAAASKETNGYVIAAFFLVILVFMLLALREKRRSAHLKRQGQYSAVKVMTIGRRPGESADKPFVSIKPIILPLEYYAVDYASGLRGVCFVRKEIDELDFTYYLHCKQEKDYPRPIALLRGDRLVSVFVDGSFYPALPPKESIYDLYFCDVLGVSMN